MRIRSLAFVPLAAAFLVAPSAPAMSADCEGGGRVEFNMSENRCRASSVTVLSVNGHLTVNAGKAAQCFEPKFEPNSDIWTWQCRGYSESSRCKGASGRKNVGVSVKLDNGRVTWKCYASN